MTGENLASFPGCRFPLDTFFTCHSSLPTSVLPVPFVLNEIFKASESYPNITKTCVPLANVIHLNILLSLLQFLKLCKMLHITFKPPARPPSSHPSTLLPLKSPPKLGGLASLYMFLNTTWTHTNAYILKTWSSFVLLVFKLYASFWNLTFWDRSVLVHRFLPVSISSAGVQNSVDGMMLLHFILSSAEGLAERSSGSCYK